MHEPHDHEVEHKAHSGNPMATRVAVMTAILATIGALISYQGGATQNSALLYKNEAAIKKTEAFDGADPDRHRACGDYAAHAP